MKNLNLLAFGEILFDIIDGQAHIGGAPFNVAAHFAKHNNQAFMVSSVGMDKLGEEAKMAIDLKKVNRNFVNTTNENTGVVNVNISESGQPSYDILEGVAWDKIILTETQIAAIKKVKWDCFYFGMLAQRSETNQQTLKKMFELVYFPTVFLDVNLRKDYFNKKLLETSFEKCTILKLNDEEIDVLAPMLFNVHLTPKEFAEKASSKFHIDIIIITLGANGAAFYENGVYEQVPGVKIKVADTVGAGDSFSAAFLNAYLKGSKVKKAVYEGCKLGAFVASKRGAIPEYDANSFI